MGDNDYDVIVVGSGPAGGQAARELSGSDADLDVGVLEKDSYVGETRQSTGGTFPRMMSEFDIPHELSMNVTDTVTLEGSSEVLDLEQRGYVLEFGEFKQYLAKKAKNNGADYLLNSKVVGLDRDVEEGLGVVTNILNEDKPTEQKTYTADVVIDASGADAVLGNKAGLVDYDPSQDLATGVEYEMEGVEMSRGPSGNIESDETMMLKVDSDYAPGGYSWIFYTGEGTAKVGVCWFKEYFDQKGGDGTLEQYFEKFWEEDPRLQNAEKIVNDEEKEGEGKFERHSGKAFIKQVDSFVDDRLILAGDTVSSIEPVWGEGIHNCMTSGSIAASVVQEADRVGDYSKGELELYEEKWHDRIGDNKSERLELADILYQISDENFDRLIDGINSLDNEELLDLTSLEDKSKMKDVFVQNPKTAFHMVKDHPKVVGKVLKKTYLP